MPLPGSLATSSGPFFGLSLENATGRHNITPIDSVSVRWMKWSRSTCVQLTPERRRLPVLFRTAAGRATRHNSLGAVDDRHTIEPAVSLRASPSDATRECRCQAGNTWRNLRRLPRLRQTVRLRFHEDEDWQAPAN